MGLRKWVRRLPERASSKNNKYAYLPLPSIDHIRILRLLPGAKEDRLCCDLKVVSIDKAEDTYDAISYVWGDLESTEDVLCNGQRIPVTTNLADALRQIRSREKTKLLWADAISIDQNNNQEKGHQVKRMGRVFQAARQVLAWLGRDTSGIAEDAFWVIRETNQYFRLHSSPIDGWPEFPRLRPPYPICSDKSRWANVAALVELPWFERVWVIQEAALAKSCLLMAGEHDMDIIEIIELALYLELRIDVRDIVGTVKTGRISGIFRRIQCTYDNTKTWRKNTPLARMISSQTENRLQLFLDVLNGGRSGKASDKRDYVYAFLGNPLARKPDGQLLVEPDYHKNKSGEDVYYATACALLQHSREAPWVFGFVGHQSLDEVEGREFPSWAPRWERPTVGYSLGRPGHWYRAGAARDHLNITIGASRSLAVTGVIFDCVSWTSSLIYFKNLNLNADQWDHNVRSAGEPFIDTLWQDTLNATGLREDQLRLDFSLTLTRGYPSRTEGNFDMETHIANFAAYRESVRTAINSSHVQEPSSSDKVGDAHDFADKAEFCNNRRIFYTDNNRLGLSSYFSQVGDVCCIFPGMSVPFVLRKRTDGKYNLVGDCYINGIMRGEIMEQLGEGKFKEETLILV
jgi:hypothetical protein